MRHSKGRYRLLIMHGQPSCKYCDTNTDTSRIADRRDEGCLMNNNVGIKMVF